MSVRTAAWIPSSPLEIQISRGSHEARTMRRASFEGRTSSRRWLLSGAYLFFVLVFAYRIYDRYTALRSWPVVEEATVPAPVAATSSPSLPAADPSPLATEPTKERVQALNKRLSEMTGKAVKLESIQKQSYLRDTKPRVSVHRGSNRSYPNAWLALRPSGGRDSAFFTSKYQVETKHIRECLRKKRVYLVGTSYQRTQFWSILRLLGAEFDPAIRMVASYEHEWISDPEKCKQEFLKGNTRGDYLLHRYPYGSIPPNTCVWERGPCCCQLWQQSYDAKTHGLAGIDLNKCGWPMNATYESSDYFVRYQFRPYLKNDPEFDRHVLREMREGGYDLVYISGGEWGVHALHSEAAMNASQTNYREALATEWIEGVVEALEGRPTWVAHWCNAHFSRTTEALCLAATKHSDRIIILKDNEIKRVGYDLERATEISWMNDHGFDGPIAEIFARTILAAACEPLA